MTAPLTRITLCILYKHLNSIYAKKNYDYKLLFALFDILRKRYHTILLIISHQKVTK